MSRNIIVFILCVLCLPFWCTSAEPSSDSDPRPVVEGESPLLLSTTQCYFDNIFLIKPQIVLNKAGEPWILHSDFSDEKNNIYIYGNGKSRKVAETSKRSLFFDKLMLSDKDEVYIINYFCSSAYDKSKDFKVSTLFKNTEEPIFHKRFVLPKPNFPNVGGIHPYSTGRSYMLTSFRRIGHDTYLALGDYRKIRLALASWVGEHHVSYRGYSMMVKGKEIFEPQKIHEEGRWDTSSSSLSTDLEGNAYFAEVLTKPGKKGRQIICVHQLKDDGTWSESKIIHKAKPSENYITVISLFSGNGSAGIFWVKKNGELYFSKEFNSEWSDAESLCEFDRLRLLGSKQGASGIICVLYTHGGNLYIKSYLDGVWKEKQLTSNKLKITSAHMQISDDNIAHIVYTEKISLREVTYKYLRVNLSETSSN